MSSLRISIGNSDFRELRTEKLLYIDKTAFLTEFLACGFPNKVTLITRPRRFGKTLMLSMLHEFLRIDQKSPTDLFAGLAVAKNRTLCRLWQNTHPVISLSFKDLKKDSFAAALEAFADNMSILYKNYQYLLESPKLSSYDKDYIRHILAQASEPEILPPHRLVTALFTLCQCLEQHHAQKVIVLIDEYDVPIQTAYEKGYYQRMLDFMRSTLGMLLKDNTSLCFALLTGCLRIAHESIFTGLNNFVCSTISDNDFADKFGFTEHEVDRLLTSTGLSEKKAEIKEWYDGYHFGKNQEIYCPWDITNYLQKLVKDHEAKPEPYWLNTSENNIVKSCLANHNSQVIKRLQALTDGQAQAVRIYENITYHDLDQNNDEVLWSLLYHTGYLTKAKNNREPFDIDSESNKTCLMLPNKEIRQIFLDAFFQEISKNITENPSNQTMLEQEALLTLLWSGQAERVTNTISELLFKTISYFDYNEMFYQAFLLGILSAEASSKFTVVSNRESGLGRPDILIYDHQQQTQLCCLEIKVAQSQEELDKKADEALRQIEQKQYTRTLSKGFAKTVKWGIAFWQKHCLAKQSL
ncbi:MAG: ATP-binding protein [Desulfovibrio sp.]|nr:ATP-binding protein [Desulfovibrio sp.]